MSLQDELLELNAVYQSVAAENEALRALLIDYQTLVDDAPLVPSSDVVRWKLRHLELQQRYDALMEGGKP